MAEPKVRPTKVAWSVQNWSSDTDLSLSYVRGLIAVRRIESVKVGKKRLITTTPGEFLASLGEAA